MSGLNTRLLFFVILWLGGFTGSAIRVAGQNTGSQPTPAQSLLALSKTDHTLAIVDPVSFKVIAKIPVGEDPHEVIASTDGKTAYVSIYGGGVLHELDLIDLVGQKPLLTLDTRPLYGPHGLAFANGKAWFTAEGSKSVGSYDPKTAKIDWSMGTGQDRTHMIYVNPDGKKIYTTNVSSGTVSILSDTLIQPGRFSPPGAKPREDWTETQVATAHGSEGFDVSPDGRFLWTVSSDDGSIAIINLDEKKLEARIDGKALGANRLKFTPDGKLALISTLRDGQLFIFDVSSRKELKRINIGHGAAGILTNPEGSLAFIGCTADNYVVIIDLKKLEVSGHIDVGGGPDGLAWASRGN